MVNLKVGFFVISDNKEEAKIEVDSLVHDIIKGEYGIGRKTLHDFKIKSVENEKDAWTGEDIYQVNTVITVDVNTDSHEDGSNEISKVFMDIFDNFFIENITGTVLLK